MDRALYLAMTGAKHIALQQATTSNNLANLHTHGFKADKVAFRALPVMGQGMPTRTYVVDSSVGHDSNQGTLLTTGNVTDFALGSRGFFAVQTPDGSEAYTRDGGYVLDADGAMLTRSGLPIVGDGGPISVPTGYSVELKEDGSVIATPTTGAVRTPQLIGQIKMINPEPNAVYKGQDGLFRLNGGNPGEADPNVKLVPEAVEASNVNAVESLVQMIAHGRHYELNINMMKTTEQDDEKATSLLAVS